MHLSDFIRHLQDLADEFGDVDPEVKIAMQENYPIEARVREITGCEGSDPKVWIAAGDATEYTTKLAWWGGMIADTAVEDDEDDDF